MTTYRVGTRVEWTWGKGAATGKITESFTEPVGRTIKGTAVKRDADKDNAAYLIRQEDGDRVLKSHSELRKTT